MDFFTALATIRKDFPWVDESELRSAMEREVKSEEERLTGQRVRNKYARAVEAAPDRLTEWLKTGHEFQVNLADIDSLARFISSTRPACVWAVLRSKQWNRYIRP